MFSGKVTRSARFVPKARSLPVGSDGKGRMEAVLVDDASRTGANRAARRACAGERSRPVVNTSWPIC